MLTGRTGKTTGTLKSISSTCRHYESIRMRLAMQIEEIERTCVHRIRRFFSFDGFDPNLKR